MHSETFFPRAVDWIKMDGKKNNLKPTWGKLMKQVDLEEPTPMLGQLNLECTQRECKLNLKIVPENRNSFVSGTVKQLLGWAKSHADTFAWLWDMGRHGKKCVKILRIG